MYQGRDMHVMSAVDLHINRNHVGLSADRLARTASIPAIRGFPEPTLGQAHLWKGCPFVAIWKVPRQPPQSAHFLLTFSSALIWGRSVADPSHQGLATGAAFVIGMLQSFFYQGGGWDVGMGRGGGETDAGGISCL